MAVLIGHASIDERGKISGGSAGDQTGKEVCTRAWYSKPWNLLLRPVSSDIAEKSAQACEKGCTNNKIGYDQNQRNTLRTQAQAVNFDLSKISTACECDCSSFMSVCAEAAGVNIPYSGGNAPATSTMRNAFTSTGKYTALTDSKYLTSDQYLKRGDILVKEGSHTVMVLQNGSKVGTSTTTTTPATSSKITTIKAVQQYLNSAFGAGLSADNSYGPLTKKALVKAIQKQIGVSADGIFGSKSKAAWTVVKQGNSGTKVRLVQCALICRGYSMPQYGADGSFGTETVNAVKSYQKNNKLSVDSLVGPATIYSLLH